MKRLLIGTMVLCTVLVACNDKEIENVKNEETRQGFGLTSQEKKELKTLLHEKHEKIMNDLDSLDLTKQQKFKFLQSHRDKEMLLFQQNYDDMREVFDEKSKGMNRQEMLNLKDSLYHVYGMDERINSKAMKFLKERVPKNEGIR